MSDEPGTALDAAASPDAGEAHGVVRHGGEDGHSAFHLPPNSFVPVSVALSLGVLFVGFLGDVRDTVGPAMWLLGLLWLIASLVFWARSARREYLELPEDPQH
jgi:hypothetical protein